MNERQLTCIICPVGCELTVTFRDGAVSTVTGNTCPRGAQYAISECTHPMRTVTGTAVCSDGRLVPVKTDVPISKERVFACMRQIHALCPPPTVSVGDILKKDVYGSNLVVTGPPAEA